VAVVGKVVKNKEEAAIYKRRNNKPKVQKHRIPKIEKNMKKYLKNISRVNIT
jgi:hypothetical protein